MESIERKRKQEAPRRTFPALSFYLGLTDQIHCMMVENVPLWPRWWNGPRCHP